MIDVKIADHKNCMLNGKMGTLAYYHPVKKGFIFHTEMKGINKNTAHHPRFLDPVNDQCYHIPAKKITVELTFGGNSFLLRLFNLK